MASSKNATRAVLEAVRHAPGCRVEDLVRSCSRLTWHDIFEALVRLNRNGRVRLVSEKPGTYTITLPGRPLPTSRHR